MKKIIAMILSLALLLLAASAMAEDAEKVTLGTVSINGAFRLQCGLPEGYSPVPGTVTPEQVTAVIRSEDPNAPIMQLSVAYDEMYSEVDRLNDLGQEDLTLLEQTFIDNDPGVEISYGETGYGTLLLIARHESEELDYITFFSIYKGYCVEFALVPSREAEDKNLTDDQLRISVQFLTDLDFIPANVPVGDPKTVAGGTYITNLTDYDPDTNTVKASVQHTITVPEETAEALQVGDTLTAGLLSEKIESIGQNEEGDILINEEIRLQKYGDEYHIYFYDMEYLETLVTLILEIPDDLTVWDNINPASGEPLEDHVQYTVDEFKAMLAAEESPDFATDNVYVSYNENGEMTNVERIYTPWQ